MAFRNQKIILVLLQLAAFWNFWSWHLWRISTSSDEAFGILALGAICILSFQSGGKRPPVSNYEYIVASVGAYAACVAFLPTLLSGVIAVTSLTFTISGWRFGRKFHPGIWCLFLLTLPSVGSMQFYLGFPLRVLVGDATVWLLKLNGLAVLREGVSLHFGEQLIWIDAPCSGIKMLWAGFFLASLLCVIYEFKFFKTALTYLAAFGIIVIGNIFRATGLFYLESGIVKLPAFGHEGIGVAAFIMTCAAIVFVTLKIKRAAIFDSSSNVETDKNFQAFTRLQTSIFVVACFAAFFVSLIGVEKTKLQDSVTAAEFPTHFENKPIKRLELTAREEIFAQDFPGETRRYGQGKREIIIRYVTVATRKLHSASECLPGNGYETTPLPVKIDENNQKWSCFRAVKNDEKLRVCERIYAENGESWTDFSAWFWSTLTRKNEAYWALTVSEADE